MCASAGEQAAACTQAWVGGRQGWQQRVCAVGDRAASQRRTEADRRVDVQWRGRASAGAGMQSGVQKRGWVCGYGAGWASERVAGRAYM